MSCNFRFELCLGILWYFLKNGFCNKTTPIVERSGSISEIHVQCRTLWSVVNCWIRYNDLCYKLCNISVYQAFMYFRGLYISSEREKKQPGIHHIKYHFFPMTPSCVVSKYALGSPGDSHYFLFRMLLSYDMNQVYFGSGFPKVYQCIIGIIYFGGFASFSMVNVVCLMIWIVDIGSGSQS
jgi:hypothetical protein